MPLIVPAETFKPFYEFCHRDGSDGFRKVVEWVATLEEKGQQSFLDLLSGSARDTLTAEMEQVVAKMKDSGMDPVAEATAVTAKATVEDAPLKEAPVEEVIAKP